MTRPLENPGVFECAGLRVLYTWMSPPATGQAN